MLKRVRLGSLLGFGIVVGCGADPSASSSPVAPVAQNVAVSTAPGGSSAAARAREVPTVPQLAARKPSWTLASPQKPGATFVAPSELSQVVAIADGGRGFLIDGVRHRTRGDSIERVAGDSPPLSRVDALPEKLGGGVLFGGPSGVHRARTFDGPLRKVAPLDPQAPRYMLGHGVVIVGDKAYDWNTGKSRTADPEAGVIVHSDGYSVSISRGRARFSKDGVSGSDLGLDGVTFAAVRERSILVQAKDQVFSLAASGKLTKVPGMRSVAFAIAKAPATPFDVASLPAAMAGSAWVDVPGAEGRRAASYQAGELVELDRESGGGGGGGKIMRRTIAVKRDDCGLLAQGPDRLLLCGGFAEDRSMTVEVHRIDLATGNVVLERTEHIDADVQRGTFVGVANGVAEGAFVLTQRTCEGEANSKRMCVRRPGGKWIAVELPRNSQVFPFLEGVYAITQRPITVADAGANTAAEQLVIRDLERGTEVLFASDVRAASMRAVGLDPTRPSLEQMLSPTSPTSRGAVLLRGNVLRTFESTPGSDHLFFVDYVLDARSIEVRVMSGEFAIADRRLLRLHDGALSESGDGGETWVDVEPPPSGVPKMLDAHCTLNGCMLGPWVRVGWATR